jgi:hypothetical protein
MDTDKAGSGGELGGEAVYDADGFDAHADYLAHQENDVVGVVFTVGVGFAFDLNVSGGMPVRVRDSLMRIESLFSLSFILVTRSE